VCGRGRCHRSAAGRQTLTDAVPCEPKGHSEYSPAGAIARAGEFSSRDFVLS
jgi:hypothetical protein